MARRQANAWIEPFRFTWAVLVGLPRALYWVVRGYTDQLEMKTLSMIIAALTILVVFVGVAWYNDPETFGHAMVQYGLPGLVLVSFATLFVFGLVSLHGKLKERRSGAARFIEAISGVVCAAFAAGLVFVFFMLGQAGLSGVSEVATGKRVVSITVFPPGSAETFKPEEYAMKAAGGAAGMTFISVLALVFLVKPNDTRSDSDENDQPRKRRKRRIRTEDKE